MKHVQEQMPDVLVARPDVSSLLAAVVDRATAKELGNRYATADDLVHDLEQVLAIEAARAGETTGEATAVLRALPGDTTEFAPLRLRRPRRWLLSVLAVALLAAGVVGFLATRTERGPGDAKGVGGGDLRAVALTGGAAHDYDPQGDDDESSEATQFAVDANPTTVWDTETYEAEFEGANKDGVGLYVDAAGQVAARRVDVTTSSPGFTAAIYAANDVPTDIGGWTKVSSDLTIGAEQEIPLDTGGQSFRYYLLWISALPDGGKAAVKELSVLK
jgi:serine/threonine-protein kinase